ncbi:MAG TPA: immunoglobulin-like domain-containing protein [Pyrinomonadaceae bacterium]
MIVSLAAAIAVLASISFVSKWGTTGSGDGQFFTPTAIAVDASGNVYVVEGGQRVQKFNNNGVFQLKFGSGGSSPGQFVSPNGIAVDSAGNIYVSDNNDPTFRVSKFNSIGTFLNFVGGGYIGPSGVAIDSADNLYVMDGNGQRVRKYDSAGTHLLDWGTGTSGSADGQFSFPQGIAVDASNNVYVADTGNSRIQKFTSGGVFITKWGTAGSSDGQFTSPSGVSAALGNVYVADTGNSRIQKFSDTGTFMESFGTGGSGDGEFSGPQDVAADSSGNIFVADSGNDRIQKLSTTAVAVVANAGTDQTVECNGATTSVTLDGTASTGSGTLTYTWKEGATTLGTGATLVTSLPTGTHTITLTVSSSGGGSDDDDVLITIADTQAPTITLNGANPTTVECHTAFSDPGATASDACAGDLTSSIVVTGSVNPNVVGSYTLTYTVSDGSHTTSTNRTVNVVDTTPPVITINGANPMTVECHTSFTDPGATANDGCAGSFPASASGTVNVNVPGTYTIIYNASDPSGNPAASQSRTVNVVDTTNPVITVNGNTPTLWSPNHKYQTFSVADFVTGVTDSCNTSLGVGSVVISQVTSDELENSGGDGNTLNDIVIAADCKSVQLRAERDGNGDGRVYTITFKVTDSSGNVGTVTAQVVVPKNQGGGPAIDSGPQYTVNGTCP